MRCGMGPYILLASVNKQHSLREDDYFRAWYPFQRGYMLVNSKHPSHISHFTPLHSLAEVQSRSVSTHASLPAPTNGEGPIPFWLGKFPTFFSLGS